MSFNTRDELGDKIDKLTVTMNRLAARDSNEKRPFKPQIYKGRGQSRSYNQRGYQNKNNRPDSRNQGQYGNNRPRQSYRDNNFRENTRGYGRQNSRGKYGIIGALIITGIETHQEKGCSQEILVTIGIEVPVTID